MDPALDRVARLAAAALQVPVALYAPAGDGVPLVLDDVGLHPALCGHPVLRERGVRACLTAPVTTGDGRIAGRLCLLDVVPRRWTDREIAVLRDFASVAATEVALGEERAARQRADLRPVGMVERLADAFVAVDRDWRITYVNAAAEQLFGRPRATLVGADAWDALPVVDADTVRVYQEAMALGERRTVIAPDPLGRGQLEITAHPGPDGLSVQLRDVTAHEHAESALRASEERFRALIEHAADVVIVIDAQGRLRYVSPPVERVLGIAPAEMIGRDAFDFVEPDDAPALRQLLADLVPTPGRAVPISYRGCHVAGGWRLFEGTARNLLHVPGVHGVVVNIADVTGRRALEAQLRQSQKLEAIGQLAGGIAHDFNNLLTVIRGNLELARETMPADSQAAEDLAEADKATTRATGLVRQLLAFGRKQVRQPAVIDVNTVVDDGERMLSRVLGGQVTLEVEMEPALWAVRADRGQLDQVLMNLALNARDALEGLEGRPDGGLLSLETANVVVTPSLARRWGVPGEGEYVRLTVRDTGIGMDDATKARIFEPFFTTKPLGRGTGLGLAVVYGIVAQSDGAVGVESELGVGTSFHVFLPRAHAERDGPVRESPVGPAGTGTILLVEDEAAVRRTTRRALERAGYAVIEAKHGADALLIWRERGGHGVDLLVTDARMPGMSGAELVARLRAERADLPVLLVSGYAAAALREELPADVRYLEKPFEAGELLAVVGGLMRAKQS